MSYVKSGVSHHTMASTHYAMMRRCYNPDYNGYKNYGGRGIGVCKAWHSLKIFVAWHDALPDDEKRKPGQTLERRDNDADYGPGNCHFATKNEQVRNTRITMRVKFRGELVAISDAYDTLKAEGKIPDGLTIDAIKTRYRDKNWSLMDAFFTPVQFIIKTVMCIAPDDNEMKFSDFYAMALQPKVKYTLALTRFKRGWNVTDACKLHQVK